MPRFLFCAYFWLTTHPLLIQWREVQEVDY